MNLKQKAIIMLILSILLMSAISASDYKGSYMDYVHMNVNENGLVHVNESFTYQMVSPESEIRVPLYHGSNASIENMHIRVNDLLVAYDLKKGDTLDELVIHPKSSDYNYDSESTGTYLLDVEVEYDIENAVKVYNDVGAFTYQINKTNFDGVSLVMAYVTIKFPGTQEHEYFIVPKEDEDSDLWDEDHFDMTDNQPTKATVIIPLDELDSDAKYAQHIDSDGLEAIKNDSFDLKYSIIQIVNILIKIFVIIAFILPIAIYLKYGREPKVTLDSIYEHEPPTDDPPFFVNAIMGGTFKDVGLVDTKAFQATIMDLINRGKLSVETEINEKNKQRTYLVAKSTDGLADYESDLISILRRYEEDGRIDLKHMELSLYVKSEARYFRGRFNSWGHLLYSNYLTDDVKAEYFEDKGSKLFKFFAYGGLILSVILFLYCLMFNQMEPLPWVIALFILSSVLICIPSAFAGHYTKKGKIFKERWNNFKKYLKDFSMMEEYPPESVAVWNKYLVYATALGVADKVSNTMKINFYDGLNDETYRDNDVFVFCDGNGLDLIGDSFSAVSTTLDSDSGGSDGVGGGSGGGGGGAF